MKMILMDVASAELRLKLTSLLPQNLTIHDTSSMETVQSLMKFNNRYYMAKDGIQASEWINEHWKCITAARLDIKIDSFSHGSKSPQDSVIVGAHLDTINKNESFEEGDPHQSKRASGADDNASAVAVITEALCVITKMGFRPKKTIQFMSFAAEEVGLIGSRDIAKK